MSKDYHVVVNQDAVYFYGYVGKKEIRKIKMHLYFDVCAMQKAYIYILFQ